MNNYKDELTISICTIGERLPDALRVIQSGPKNTLYMVLHQNSDKYRGCAASEIAILERSNGISVMYLPIKGEGVTISRNIAIELCESKFMLFADDDVIFTNRLIEAYKCLEENGSGIGTFICLNDDQQPRKTYPTEITDHNRLSILSVGTVEIIINVALVRESECKFPVNMGAGKFLSAADEPIFLARFLRSGGKVTYFPLPIVSHNQNSSGNMLKTEGSLASRGVVFRDLFGLIVGFFLLTIFIFKSKGKFSPYNGLKGIFHSFYFMFYGFFKLEAN